MAAQSVAFGAWPGGALLRPCLLERPVQPEAGPPGGGYGVLQVGPRPLGPPEAWLCKAPVTVGSSSNRPKAPSLWLEAPA
jgi:hypothetical protein